MIKFKLFIVLSVMVAGCLTSVAQEPVPQILPPSPEPFAFTKAGLGAVNFSTGAVQSSIPLFELKVNNLSQSVSIDYQSQGTRVDEISSRIGLGWTLNIGGVITRIVRGAPDEMSIQMAEPADLQAQTMATYRYFDYATQADPVNEYDTQKDEFNFSVGGYSGKFVLDTGNNAVIQSHTNVKIKAYTSYEDYTSFVMTTPDGTKYYFGNNSAFEKTVTHNLYAYSHYENRIKTSFFLTKIENPAGQTITFNYSSLSIVTHPGITHTVIVRKGVTGMLNCNHCPATNTIVQNTINSSVVEYDTKYLTSVVCSNGQSAELTYEDRPDYSDDKRITSVKMKFNGNVLKTYNFTYYDQYDGSGVSAAGTSPKNGRFFLTKLAYEEPGSAAHEYKFQYNDPSALPARLSFDQDYLGFYNGATNSNCFIPANSELSPSTAWANRSPNATYAAKGVLQKITYPTGGSEEFFLEGNTIPELLQANTMDTLTLNGTGTGTPGATEMATFTGSSFLVRRAQVATITASSFQNSSYSGIYYPANYEYIVRVKLKNLTTNSYAFQATLYAYSNATHTVNLYPDNRYRMELYVYNGWSNKGTFTLAYDYSAEDVFNEVNTHNGGIRVKKIRLYDSVNNKTVQKFYHYAPLSEMTKSSGVGPLMINPVFVEPVHSSLLAQFEECYSPELGVFIADPFRSYEICHNDAYSSNSATPLNIFDNSHIYYTSIIESDDSLFINGGTEYNYYYPSMGRTDYVVKGVRPPGVPSMNMPLLNGVLKEKKTFNNNYSVIREEYNEYGYDTTYAVRIPSVDIRRKYVFYGADSAANNTVTYTDVFDAFDVVKYDFQSLWIHPVKTLTKEIDANGIVKKDSIMYEYGSSINTEPFKTVSSNSKGQTVELIKYYPTDFPLDATLQKLVQKNIIAVPVEEVTKVNTNEMQRRKITYGDWYGDQTVLQPTKVEVKHSPDGTLQDAIVFNTYNKAGLLTNYSKPYDIPVSYIYDGASLQPLAEIRNADTTDIAFTSFETASRGYWQVYGTLLPEGSSDLVNYWTLYTNDGITGHLSFGGRMTKSTNSAKAYFVTLWCKNTYSATVNSNSGTLLETKNGWNLYRWEITGQSSVTVQGNHIDDVRLYPKDALMTSYVYNAKGNVSSITDINNSITYYEYDSMNRLWLIRDADKNVVKKLEYKYGQTVPCTDTTAAWENTSTALRCQVNGSFEYTGYQEQEQRNMNPCSATFNQLRWTQTSYNATACPLEVDEITVTYQNYFTVSGFTVQLTNTGTSQVFSFTAAANSSGTLGLVPAGTYNIVFTRITSGLPWMLLFGTDCHLQSGTNTATFNNVNITSCNHMTINYDEL